MQRKALNDIGNYGGSVDECNKLRRSNSFDTAKKATIHSTRSNSSALLTREGQTTERSLTHVPSVKNGIKLKENVESCSRTNITGKVSLKPEVATILPYGVIDLALTSEVEESGFDFYDFMTNLRFKEKDDLLDRHFLLNVVVETTQVTESMRSTLIDWLIHVHAHMNYHADSLYIAVKLLDKYTARTPVLSTHFQLTGIVAFWIATKLEEYKTPSVRELVHLTKDAFTKQEVLHCEKQFLKVLNFNLHTTPPTLFLNYYTLCVQSPHAQFHDICSYAMDSLLPTMEYVDKKPSQIAAAATLTGILVTTGSLNWDLSLTYYSGYQVKDLLTLTRAIIIMWLDYGNPNYSLKATFKKYKYRKQYKRLTKLPFFEPWHLLNLLQKLHSV